MKATNKGWSFIHLFIYSIVIKYFNVRPALLSAFIWAVREGVGIIKEFYMQRIWKCRVFGEGLSENQNNSSSSV